MKENGVNDILRLDLYQRTKEYALRIIRVYVALPKSTEAQVLGKQVLRSGTSIGAHYREASRAKSDADFIHKMETGLQELEETAYWLELITDANLFSKDRIDPLVSETRELNAVFTTIVKKVKARKR